ncbi:peroxiredoxin [Caulobacter sp. NIBR1757]|uniref:peroxiredoxin n=1 Tax=Caulobacter sp. NIBR1757 TaxID=3016000 RepID=UPI0022F04A66|nr:peroxiredoxin [Caulobacter sp. NIBR1757]WGM39172.1 Thiol-disulfide oxidoreductase ResA [Caulobacter sp. NIBR1757]
MNRRLLLSAIAAVSVAAVGLPAFAALKVGTRAPDFTLPGFKAGKPVTYSLAEARKKGPVVVYFFPAAFTGGCDLEAHLFAEAADDYAKAGASIIGVTAGSIERLQEFSSDNARCSGKFPVAADKGAKVAKLWDSTLPVGISNRTSYVIAPDGTVVYVHSEMNAQKHVELTLDAVRKWKAGKKG